MTVTVLHLEGKMEAQSSHSGITNIIITINPANVKHIEAYAVTCVGNLTEENFNVYNAVSRTSISFYV
jgi:hypothetical protein